MKLKQLAPPDMFFIGNLYSGLVTASRSHFINDCKSSLGGGAGGSLFQRIQSKAFLKDMK